MRWLLSKFLKGIAILLVAAGFLVGVLALCWTLLYASLWLRGGELMASDRRIWRIAAELSAAGAAAFVAGIFLLRDRAGEASGHATFRLSESPRLGRRSMDGQWTGTVSWLAVGAMWFMLRWPGSALERCLAAGGGVVALYLGAHVTFLVHELGHALAAKALGLDLFAMQIGTGPRSLAGSLGGTRWEWRPFLGGAFVRAGDFRERGWRLRQWLYVAGGPVAQALLIAASVWFLLRLPADSGTKAGWPAFGLFALCGWTYFTAMSLLFALSPRRVRIGPLVTWTDGHRLLSVPRMKTEEVRESVIGSIAQRAILSWEEGRRDEAWGRVRDVQTLYPGHVAAPMVEAHFLTLADRQAEAAASIRRALDREGLAAPVRAVMILECFSALAAAGDCTGARQFADDCLREPGESERAEMLDVFSTAVLFRDLGDFLPDAERWSAEMLALEPASLTRQGTRGGVLIERGEIEAGATLLREVWERSTGQVDAALSALFLGIAARKQGDGPGVRKWRREAWRFQPGMPPWFERRLTRDLSAIGMPLLGKP